jgi:hypothetical protein
VKRSGELRHRHPATDGHSSRAGGKAGAVRTIRAVGRVFPEDTLIYRVNSGVTGLSARLNNDSVGVRVRKDQDVGDLLCVGLPGRRLRFHATIQSVPGPLASTDRLRNLGMSECTD